MTDKSRKNNWLKIWTKKGKKLESIELNDIIKANGFDSTLGKFNSTDWRYYINQNLKLIKLKKKSSILEYGCGAGAFLSFWYNKNYNLYGIDYSKTLIHKAKKIFPKINFKIGEISSIKKFNTKFDLIFAHSVFQYFDNYDYARKLILNMISNLRENGNILILDIPDKSKEKNYKKKLKNILGNIDFKRKYSTNSHLFYDKNYFKEIAKENNLKIKIVNQSFRNYPNSRFRFNVLLFKKN